MKGPHKAGDEINGRYEILDFVGEGGMQFVYQAWDKNVLREIALKTPKSESAEKRFNRSAIVAARVNHPNVAKTLDFIPDYNGRAYLIEEHVTGHDLDAALLKNVNSIDPYLVSKLFHHLARGLAASHHVNVVHRDLKPTNVMINGGFNLTEIKITDFGIAKMADEEIAEAAEGGTDTITASQTAVGALPYMAPEAINTPRDVGTPADIWSLGAMMYELIVGEKPFGSGLKAVHAILEAKPPQFPTFVTSNPQFQALANQLIPIIAQCLLKEPTARPTADMLVNMCGSLCYPISLRYRGIVETIKHHAWGFIRLESGKNVFFHKSSVYGNMVSVDDTVMISFYPGGGEDRAHPVVLLA